MSSMVLDGAMPRSRSTDPDTSVDAGRVADLNGSQAEVLAVFRTMKSGLTQGDLEKIVYRRSPSRVRSAVSELESCGLVEWTGETRLTRYGRPARVYRAVPTG